MHNKTEVPLQGPLVTSVSWDEWEPSWGAYHHGIRAGVCANNPQGWKCAGLQVKFDRPIVVRQSYGAQCISAQQPFAPSSDVVELSTVRFGWESALR